MIPLPYALLDRICDLATQLDDTAAEALAEVLRTCPDGRHSRRTLAQLQLMCDTETRGRLAILFDTWCLTAPHTSGAEIAAALYAATVQRNRVIRAAKD